ncbi:hypothetical protein [Sphingomonas sp. M1-B02]|uniref:hypothetical protein n=1 Tax=Sphingomonas sp. M1-B02 TaxID=3114300 RepID=UPI0022401D66|nr:hypothetical protein [Sphingomonas sp. S6-11]UZK66692.1 hypothetical protein OKW87_02305 [Sphingomonas sp. S6-11]
MSPLGTYWSQSSQHEDAAYVVREDLIFTACHFDQDMHEGDYYSEYDEPTPEEIRLLASLALSIGLDRGTMAQYPCVASVRLDERRRLDDPQVIAEVETSLRRKLSSDTRQARGAVPMPPGNYEHFHWPLPISTHQDLRSNIDASDHLMIRGLATWMKASMMNMHEAFGEEANYPLWISLDASFAVIQEIVRANGVSDPSAVDCQAYIHDSFGEANSGLKYFEEFYADRIMTMHPRNRFGTFAFAPISHCDFYALHDALREVYRYILLGEVVDPQQPFDTDSF